MNILQIVTQLERAGAQTFAFWLEKTLSQHGTGIAAQTKFFYLKQQSDLFPTANCYVKGKPSKPGQLIGMLRLFRRDVSNSDVTICHTHYSIVLTYLVLMTIARKRRPSIISVHHWPLDRYPNSVQVLLRLRWLRPTRVIEVSVADDLVEGSTVIYNPVPRCDNLRDGDTEVSCPGFDLIAVARHSHEKGLDTLINALRRLPDRHLTLFGSGTLTEDLAKLAQDTGVASRVTFAGSLPRPDVLGAMSRCRTLVMPSRWEAMPMSLLEAVSVDSPIVLSDIAAHRRFIEFGAGVPFRVDDDVDLANAIDACDRGAVQVKLAIGRSRLQAEQSESLIGRSWLLLVKSQSGAV